MGEPPFADSVVLPLTVSVILHYNSLALAALPSDPCSHIILQLPFYLIIIRVLLLDHY